MWMRYVNIVLTPKDDPSKKMVFNRHRIDFVVRSTIGWPADTANITILNLSLEEVKFLQSRNYGEIYVDIQAGYVDELNRTQSIKQQTLMEGQNAMITIGESVPQTLFSGVITNSVGYKRPPEHVTELFCISKAYGNATDFKQMQAIPPNTKLADAIRSMANDYGFTTVSTFGVGEETLNTVLKLGRTFHDTFLNEFRNMLGEYNLNYTMTTGEIQIFPDTYGNLDAVDRMAKDREPILVDKNTVLGNPVAGICTFNLNVFLNSSIQPGMVLDVSQLLGTDILANGVVSVSGPPTMLNTDDSVFRYAAEDKYFIMEVIHHGSNRTNEFQTSVSAIIGGNSAMGGNELAWQAQLDNAGYSDYH